MRQAASRGESCLMGVKHVPLSEGAWDVPLAAIFCIAIAAYVAMVIIGLSIRQCLLKKGMCGSPCPDVACCSCAELGLHCAQACCNCGPLPSFASIMDHCCPADQRCSCLSCGTCEVCEDCSYCSEWCPTLPCDSCQCPQFSAPECSTINCLCCEITIKGKGTQEGD
ncbi:hypothetical protein O3P69_006616 [Scylla paramamosain]|uniref:Uncharacterized protein n=1 Tax=Scylla paramamosain TaxID=85552 RepID=A0AAW0U5A4_SCYPA